MTRLKSAAAISGLRAVISRPAVRAWATVLLIPATRPTLELLDVFSVSGNPDVNTFLKNRANIRLLYSNTGCMTACGGNGGIC